MCIIGAKQKECAHGLFLSVLQSLATTLARGRKRCRAEEGVPLQNSNNVTEGTSLENELWIIL